jgi:hypothetical protein
MDHHSKALPKRIGKEYVRDNKMGAEMKENLD